jgi:carboxyl-terminal processing protease
MQAGLSGILLVLGWILITACSADTLPTQTPEDVSPNPQSERQLQVFTEMDLAIRQRYLYEDYGGVDWKFLSSDFRTRVEFGISDDAFYAGVIDLIDQLPEGSAVFIRREDRITSQMEDSDLYEGIGAFVSFRSAPLPHIVILSVIMDSPAEEAGLQAHDSIYAIDGLPISDDEGLSAVERIRGPHGSTVLLEVASPREEPREILVTRDKILAADVPRGGLFESGIYYLLAPVNADASLLNSLDVVFQQVEADNIQGLILDLRIAHSASEWPLGEMLTTFTDGQLGAFISRDERGIIEIEGQDISGSQSLPLAVLIGPDTSGAPEIFASALGDRGRAHIIGMPTPGNVLGMEQITLVDGSVVIFSASSYETINGFDLAQTGNTPHLLVDVDWDQATLATDPVILMAIEMLLEEPSQQ